MITVYPSYYKDFTCIAGDCRHSCCIGWEIDIDDETLEKYRSIGGAFGLARNLEYIAQLQLLCMSTGKPLNVLNREQMDVVMEKFKSYGQPGAKKTGY